MRNNQFSTPEFNWKEAFIRYGLVKSTENGNYIDYLFQGALQTLHLHKQVFNFIQKNKKANGTYFILTLFLDQIYSNATQAFWKMIPNLSKEEEKAHKGVIDLFLAKETVRGKKKAQNWQAIGRNTFAHSNNILSIINFIPSTTELNAISASVKRSEEVLTAHLKKYNPVNHLTSIDLEEFDFTSFKESLRKASSIEDNIYNLIKFAETLLDHTSKLNTSLTHYLLALICIEVSGDIIHTLTEGLSEEDKNLFQLLRNDRNKIAHSKSLSELLQQNIRIDVEQDLKNIIKLFNRLSIAENKVENPLPLLQYEEDHAEEEPSKESQNKSIVVKLSKKKKASVAKKLGTFDKLAEQTIQLNKYSLNLINVKRGTNYSSIHELKYEDHIITLASLVSEENFKDFDIIAKYLGAKINFNITLNKKTPKEIWDSIRANIFSEYKNSDPALLERIEQSLSELKTISGGSYILANAGSKQAYKMWKRLIELGFNIQDYCNKDRNKLITLPFFHISEVRKIHNFIELIEYHTDSSKIDWLTLANAFYDNRHLLSPMILIKNPQLLNSTYTFELSLKNVNKYRINYFSNLLLERISDDPINNHLELFIAPFIKWGYMEILSKLIHPNKFASYAEDSKPLLTSDFLKHLYSFPQADGQIIFNLKSNILFTEFLELILDPENSGKYPEALELLSDPQTFVNNLSSTCLNFEIFKPFFTRNIIISPSTAKIFNIDNTSLSLYQIIMNYNLFKDDIEASILLTSLKAIRARLISKFEALENDREVTSQELNISKAVCAILKSSVRMSEELGACIKNLAISSFSKPIIIGSEENEICAQIFSRSDIIWSMLTISDKFSNNDIKEIVKKEYGGKLMALCK